jgi:hypothetical protein
MKNDDSTVMYLNKYWVAGDRARFQVFARDKCCGLE